MDSNLEDTLNLEGDMGSMDFDHSGVVVSQEDITLETTGHEDDIPMEFEHIEEQPVLMDTGNEEIIISDFMGDQFGLQEYSIKDEATTDASGTIDATQLQLIPSQSDSMIDLQFDPMTMTTSVASEMSQHKYIAVKAAMAPPRGKKVESTTTSLPRQVAIAPKPPKLVPTVTKASFVPKQYAIAPKPVALVSNRSVVKKMVTGVIQSGSKSGNVLTQIGKQLVMVPTSGGQKIKLVTSGGGIPSVQYVRANSDQAQLIKNVAGSNPQKQMLAKVIVQGQSNMDSSQPAVITKLMPNTATPQTRYVMQQKTVPISIGGNKVLLASPTKQGVRFAKKQIIAIKSPTPKLMPMTSQSGTTAKKVVITTNPNQNVILKTTAPPKTTQVSKDGNVVVQAQRSQLHQINVPGKGIQYIRLITNPSPATHKQAPAPAPPAPPAPGKNITLSDHKGWILDSKGNLLQMTTDKVSTGQPPPLVFSRNIVTTNKVSGKPQKTLVRLAPIASKPTQVAPLQQQQTTRPSQSLLAPISAMSEVVLEEIPEALEEQSIHDGELEVSIERSEEPEPADCKAALRALVEDAVGTQLESETMHKLEVEFDGKPTPEEDSEGSIDDVRQSSNRSSDHPLIVIPSNYDKQERTRADSDSRSMDERNYSNVVNIEVEGMPYLSPKPSLTLSETDQSRTNDLGLRPRKACNCTKSQCLKLYCDCFANGEFCNRCNCNNCHNNLENEELRQKAIRTCLERNPNAFRPKIGKAKSGGPEIVRRHNKGCNCKRSGCLKNYCECYEAKIACTAMCKCVGCRNVEETLARRRDAHDAMLRPAARPPASRQPCSFMTTEVIEAVCQCLLAAAVEGGERDARAEPDPISDVIEEFARCLQDIVGASHQAV